MTTSEKLARALAKAVKAESDRILSLKRQERNYMEAPWYQEAAQALAEYLEERG